MRALDTEVVEAAWAAVKDLVPARNDHHPLGCHRRRVPDRVCFEALLIRLVTGCSWVDAERLSKTPVSDTTLRARRDEWATAGVFDALVDQALAAYDRVIGLDLSEVAVDGSAHKAPCGGEGAGPSPTDRAKLGWKWSALTDRHGIPLGWAVDGANRHDVALFASTLDQVAARGLLADVETLHLDGGYDNPRVVVEANERGLTDIVCGKRRPKGHGGKPSKAPLGLRWPIERTNSWLSNYGQLRRNTDRKTGHRLAQFALAVALIITGKLIDWRNRWSPN